MKAGTSVHDTETNLQSQSSNLLEKGMTSRYGMATSQSFEDDDDDLLYVGNDNYEEEYED